MKTDTSKLLIYGAVAAGALLAMKIIGVASDAKEALANAGGSLGRGLYDFFHKDTEGETLFYTVKFPDSLYHAVPSRSVDSDGYFLNSNLSPTYKGDGKRYRIVKSKTPVAGRSPYVAVYA